MKKIKTAKVFKNLFKSKIDKSDKDTYQEFIGQQQKKFLEYELLLQKYDYDCDGIISFIDFCILADVILNRNNSSHYDSQNKTFNGKSLDLYIDGTINAIDINSFANKVLDYIETSFPPIDLKCQINHYEKPDFSGVDWITDYCDSHNGEYPTLDELKAAYNAA